jgi:hypothetical protein
MCEEQVARAAGAHERPTLDVDDVRMLLDDRLAAHLAEFAGAPLESGLKKAFQRIRRIRDDSAVPDARHADPHQLISEEAIATLTPS